MAFPVLYKNPIPLNKNTFAFLRIQTKSDYSFAANTHQVPAFGPEFTIGSLHYPIVFIRSAEGDVLPLFLLGFREGENLYLDAQGKWKSGYIPAYVRRYPFILAEEKAGSAEAQVWIDQDGFEQNDEGVRLFDDAGGNTTYFENVLTLLRNIKTFSDHTLIFCEQLKQLDILEERDVNVTLDDGRKYAVKGMLMVNEAKLNALSDEVLLKLMRAGYLGWIYCHMLSLNHLYRLTSLAQ